MSGLTDRTLRMSDNGNELVPFEFGRYGSAEQFRAACKRRGVIARQRLEVVLVDAEDVEHVRQLARRYHVRRIDGSPAP